MSKRLYFGNPIKVIDVKPLPKGERRCFGEPPITPANAPVLPPNVTVLAYGNSPMTPHTDVPFKIVDGKPTFERPGAPQK